MKKSSFLDSFEMSRSSYIIKQRTPTIILKDAQVSCSLKCFNAFLKVSKISLLTPTFHASLNNCLVLNILNKFKTSITSRKGFFPSQMFKNYKKAIFVLIFSFFRLSKRLWWLLLFLRLKLQKKIIDLVFNVFYHRDFQFSISYTSFATFLS